MARGKRHIHVIPVSQGWGIKREGDNNYREVTMTKAEAMEIGRELAKELKTELVIHSEDGKIQDSDSYGRDPRSTKDTIH